MTDVGTGGLLLVHAHPDDETITTGATMAHYAARGVPVTLLTCTLGEEGEILVPELAQLEAAQADQLGGLRIGELAAAMRALGVSDHRFLGGAGRYRDSGMMGSAANGHPRAFWRCASDAARFEEAVAAAVAVVREVRPQVLVTYDPDGDYGHLDHVMAHRVAMAAVERATDPAYGSGEPWTVARVYWTATLISDLEDDERAAREHGRFRALPAGEHPMGVADDVVTTSVDASGCLAAKTEALAAHRTQVVVDPPMFALSNLIGRQIRAVEHFRQVRGDRDPAARDQDLFAGPVEVSA